MGPRRLSSLLSSRAFSLIELLVVILVLGVLIAVAVPAYLGQKEKAQDSATKQYLTVAYKAAKASTVVEPYSGSYPTPPSTLRQRLEEIEPGLAFSTGPYCSNASGAETEAVVVDSDDSSASTLKLYGESDSGKIFQLTATSTGSPQIIRACSAPVVAAAAGAPAVSGTKQVGQQLTVSNGSNWESDNPLTYTYQWQNCGPAGDSCQDLSGAVAQNYVVQPADEDDRLRARVTATNVAGSETQETPTTTQVLPLPPVASGPGPAVSGTARVGDELMASSGSWGGTPPITYSYQWLRCQDGTDPADDCVAIGTSDASDDNDYTAVAADEGKYLRTLVTASNAGGPSYATSAATSTVLPAPPTAQGTGPTVSGTYQEGMVLTVNAGSWGGTGPISYSYQWQRCGETLASCANISGATAQSYTLTSGDVDSRVVAVVFATNAGGTTSARTDDGDPATATPVVSSAPVGVVVAYAGQSVPSGWLLADGAAVSRSTYAELFAETGTAYGAGNGSTTFNLPNLQGRLPLGKASSGPAATLGASGGVLDASGSVSLGSLTYNFSWTDSAPNPSFAARTYTWNAAGAVGASDYPWVGTHGTIGPVTFTTTESGSVSARSVSASGTVSPTASYSALNPPFRALRYIVKATATGPMPDCAVVSSAATVTPAGATTANGSAAAGALASCLDPAFGGQAPDLGGRFALGKAQAGTGSTLNSGGGQLAQSASVTRNQASTAATVTPTPYSLNMTISSPAPSSLSYSVISTQYAGNNWDGVCTPDPPSCSQSNSRGPVGPFGSAHSPSAGSDNGAVVASNNYAPSLTTTQAPAQTATSSTFSAPYLAVNFHTGLTSSKPGDLLPFAGSTLPPGYLRADGACYATSAYDALFAAIGYTYGGSGASFCVPDLGGRSPLSKAASGTASTLGASGGTLAATPSATFTGWTPQLSIPLHTFSWTTPNHTYNISGGMNGTLRSYCASSCYGGNTNATIVHYNNYGVTYPSVSGGSQVVSSNAAAQTVNAAAVGTQTANLPAQTPPYQVVNYLIKR